MEAITALILAIALEVGVPPNFALAIALTENWSLNPNAISSPNSDGSRDYGVMQLNSRYFNGFDWRCAETNIRIGVEHIKWLTERPAINTYWLVAVAYNAGMSRVHNPPAASLRYAASVMARWEALESGYVNPIIQRRR